MLKINSIIRIIFPNRYNKNNGTSINIWRNLKTIGNTENQLHNSELNENIQNIPEIENHKVDYDSILYKIHQQIMLGKYKEKS